MARRWQGAGPWDRALAEAAAAPVPVEEAMGTGGCGRRVTVLKARQLCSTGGLSWAVADLAGLMQPLFPPCALGLQLASQPWLVLSAFPCLWFAHDGGSPSPQRPTSSPLTLVLKEQRC